MPPLSALQLLTIVHFFLWSQTLSYTESNNGNRIRCPWRCRCEVSMDSTETKNVTEWSVMCDKKTSWGVMPRLPMNTVFLSLYKSNIPALKPAKNDRGRRTLRIIWLKCDNISTVDGKYFRRLSKLKKLDLTDNKIQFFSNDTFVGIPNLTEIKLSKNSFNVIPSQNICLLKKLQILDLASNKLTKAKFDKCFTELSNLSCTNISHNYLGTIQESDFYSLRNSSITEMVLNSVGLKELSSNVFKWLPRLRKLDIQNNKLSNLEQEAFIHIPGLISLTLGNNKLNLVPNTAIKNLIHLEYLDIQSLNLNPSTLNFQFLNLTHLTSLNVRRNPLYNLYNSSFIGLNLRNLKELNLDDCRLRNVEADSFLPFRNLEFLTMKGWNSRSVTAALLEKAFYGLRLSRNLTRLVLDNSNFAGLNNMTFQYFANTTLQYLRSRGSKIEKLPSGIFYFLPNLQYLDLQSNWIQTIEKNAFPPHNKLITLDLAKNRLARVPYGTDANLSNLKCLVLKRNFITWLWKNSLDGYKMLEKLNLDGNKITTLHHPLFRNGSNLKTLILSHNQISTITPAAFVGLQQLTDLLLDNNDIVFIDQAAFASAPNLKNLVLSYNGRLTTNIKTDFAKLFKPLHKLTVLQIIAVGLKKIPKDIFEHMANLTILSMSSNSLSTLDPILFHSHKKLRDLTIMENQLLTLNREIIDNLPNLQLLDASSNVFACDCRIQWFADWIRLRHVYVRRLDSTICIPPKQKNKVPLMNLHLEGECMSFTFYYVYWFGLVSYMCLVASATELYRLRWYIRYWMHLVRDRRAKEREMEEGRYVFDAFVSYAHQDQDWVVHELLPKVEYKAGIRLCLHQRNWLAGRTIIGNIVNSIEMSRKTVLVLSNNFARSKWAEMEMSLAQHTTRREVVVPILLEPIQKRYVTAELVCLFATQTYIQWPQRNDKKQRRFWKCLIKTLRPPKLQPEYDEDNQDFLMTI